MNYSNKIPDKSTNINISLFGGLNRRIKASVGEFSDMENMGHGEYPCLSSTKNHEIVYSPGEEIIKYITPKYSKEEITGFTGIVKKSNGSYYVFFNGNETSASVHSFTDAIDFNGSIITFPKFKGYNYIKNDNSSNAIGIKEYGNYNSFEISNDGDSAKNYTVEIKFNYPAGTTGTKPWEFFEVGQMLAFSGFMNENAVNNTIYPETSQDYSNTTNPVSITVSEVRENGYIVCIARNCKGERIKLKEGTFAPEGSFSKGYIELYVPQFDCACSHGNRLWIGSRNGEMVQASALGSPFEFYNLGVLSTDSWYAEVGTPGAFTGITSWQNRILAFKEEWIHVIYGTEPSNFSLEKSYANGCICKESIANVANSVIWLSHDGFYEYSGGVPKRISDKLNTKYISCVAFGDIRRYFARCEKENGEHELIIFDTETGFWTKLSDFEIKGGEQLGDKVYIYDSENVYILGGGEHGDFFAETVTMDFGSFRDKSLVYLQIKCVMGQNAFLNVYTAVDGGEWIPHKGIDKGGKHKLPIRYNSGDTLRIRFEGSGEVHITDAELMMNSDGN